MGVGVAGVATPLILFFFKNSVICVAGVIESRFSCYFIKQCVVCVECCCCLNKAQFSQGNLAARGRAQVIGLYHDVWIAAIA